MVPIGELFIMGYCFYQFAKPFVYYVLYIKVKNKAKNGHFVLV